MMAGIHLRWPADRLYWAVLDTTGLPPARSRRARERQLGYVLERFIPLPLERVYAAYRRLDDHRVLACAAERDLLADLDPDAVTLTPESIPSFIEEPVDPDSFNLLTGQFEPRIVKAARARWRFELAAAVLLVALIGTLGLVRRADWHGRRAADAAIVIGDLYDRVLDPGPSVLPASLRLTTELRRLSQTRTSPAAATMPRDAGAALGAVLSLWPADLEARTESIVVAESQITITSILDTNEQVQALADLLGRAEGWTIAQPTFHENRGRVRGIICLTRAAEAAR